MIIKAAAVYHILLLFLKNRHIFALNDTFSPYLKKKDGIKGWHNGNWI